jgi:spore germination cell wall hydrolase CwlJ-like protein
MKTTKRVLVTFLVTVLFAILFNSKAYAAELNQNGTVPGQEAVTEESINTANTTDLADTEGTDEATPTESTLNIIAVVDGHNIFQTADGNYVDEEDQLYVIDYVDEQGQTYYKKADEIVTEEPKEEIEEEQEQEETKDSVESKPAYSEKDLRLMSSLIYSEAGNQPYKGMLAVANVVLNRVKSDSYSHVDTIKEAIYDKKWAVQFAVTIKSKSSGVSALDRALKLYDTGKYNGSYSETAKKNMNRAIKAAKAALQGDNNIGSFLCFQNVRSSSRIKKNYSDYKVVGDHIFYRTK